MNNAKILLTTLTDLVPPTAPARHTVVLTADGRLEIGLFLGDKWKSFILDDGDLVKDPKSLAKEIVGLALNAFMPVK